MRRRRVRALEWAGSRLRTISQSERARSGRAAFSYIALRLLVSVMICRVSEEDDLPLSAPFDFLASMRSSASVNVSAASMYFLSLKRVLPLRSISSMRRCKVFSSSSLPDEVDEDAAVEADVDAADE